MTNDTIQKLTEIFSHFPGIGPRQAKRFTYHLLSQSEAANKYIADLILKLKRETGLCRDCFKFSEQMTTGGLCKICSDPSRNRETLMIIAKDVDLENIERTDGYEGIYFTLGGLLPILEKKPEEKIRSRELVSIIEKRARENKGFKEIILALSANTEGDYTADHLKNLISPFAEKHNFKITILGRGLSTGSELEYIDSDTLKNALKNRE